MKVGIARITGKFARRLTLKSSSHLELIQGDAFDKEAIAKFAEGLDVLVCCYLGGDELMVNGQKLLIDACEAANVPRYVASDWALDYTKLKLGELFPKDPMIHVKAYLDKRKSVEGVHVLIGGFVEPIFSPFFNIVDVQTNTIRYWGEGNEVIEGTTYDDVAKYTAKVVLDKDAKEIAKSYEEVYGVPATLEKRGSLDDLYKTMHEMRAKDPQNIYSYMSL
ncbi:hypothetical protein BDV19DRAFT_379176 [Aspergillus venezuelensis]